MNRVVSTAATAAGARGAEFGRACAETIAATWSGYLQHFEAGELAGEAEIEDWGEEALAATAAWSPPLAEEIEGIARGAGLPAAALAAVNARTEILAMVSARRRAECSVIAALDLDGGRPLAAQTWDWHQEFAGCWLVWGLTDGESGMRVQTLTEAGMLAKLGVNSAGVAALINVLHHESDGLLPLGVPIHVLMRRILAESETIFDALRLIASVQPSASTAITLLAAEGGEDTALTAELRPGAPPGYVLPTPEGLLTHTNHFLSPGGLVGDLEPLVGPDSMFRLEILRRRGARLRAPSGAELVGALSSHLGGGGAICCHPEPGAALGERYGTLATVVVDPVAGSMRVLAGGPCEAREEDWIEVFATQPQTQEVLDVRSD
ncbi:MAG: C45 family autoproteolytic acyltransferase/hydrolase [Solirubrobacterales bacterium]